jgi:hypothetical protein
VCNGAGTCTHPITAGNCLIGGVCYADGTRQPGAGNECYACVAATNQTAWTAAPSGWSCPTDAYACTGDVCNGAGTCTHPITAGWCLIGVTCYANGALNPVNQCQACLTATSQVAWSNRASGTGCTDDGHTCTTDTCDGAGTCVHPYTGVWAANDTCAGATALTTSGSGASRIWTGSGDTYCGQDHYSSPCGGAGGPDLVHSFNIPVEYDTYRYRAMVGGPAGFNSVEYFYGGNTVVPGCGQSSAYLTCNNDGVGACWSAIGGALGSDANDSCWTNAVASEGVSFPNGQNWAVVDSIGAGNTYQIKVDRTAVDISNCNFPMPELQMGGTWTGTTCDPTGDWVIYMYYCQQTYGADCYYFNMYHINHAVAPWNTLTRGYVAWTDGTVTPGGMDTVLFFSVNRCDSPWYLLSSVQCPVGYFHILSGMNAFF